MSTWIKVARYHLADRRLYLWAPWGFLVFVFVVNLIITAVQGGPNPTKAVAGIYAVFFVVGVLSIVRSLPFGLALGVSRRTYFIGTALLAALIAALDGLVLAALQAIETATGGWGVDMHFFQVGHIFPGPWYLTWLSSLVCLLLVFAYGMCVGIVVRRWEAIGLVVFLAPQAVVVLAGFRWESVNHFFAGLSAAGLTGVLAAVTAVFLAAGYAMTRRVTV
jgi:uncharacterized membrane protein YhaH (DUF805 family)